MTVELTDQQAAGIEAVRAWYQGARDGFTADVFRWFGYAGTGKTFTAARIPEALGLNNVVFGTYTGKAASVLRRSLAKAGADGADLSSVRSITTIHSAIYFPTTSEEARQALRDARAELEDLYVQLRTESEMTTEDAARLGDRVSELQAQIPELEAATKRLRWEFNPESDWAYADLIVLDEVSMVNASLAGDIESYGVPILVLGDPAQLPPVEGGGYYTDAKADWLLTEIQRTALESPVTALATRVRESRTRALGLTAEDMTPASITAAMDADVVLVWSNKRRWAMINAIRSRKFGLGPMDPRRSEPLAGDVIMCLSNNKDMAVFNGELFEVLDVAAGTLGPTLKVRTETGLQRDLPVYAEGFRGQDEQAKAKGTGLGIRGNRMLATFGQAITVHKAQGSEWPHVYVVNETPNMISFVIKREGPERAMSQGRQWLYTAVTRAQERITISEPR